MGYVFIGASYFLGEHRQNSAVDLLKASGAADRFGAAWVDIKPDFSASQNTVLSVNRALAETIKTNPNSIPVIFTLDCTNAIGAVAGLQDQNPAVIWYDAHGDFNTPETSPSGFLGGMSLAMVAGRGNEMLREELGLKGIAEADIIISNARDLDTLEGEALHNSQIKRLPNFDDLLTVELPKKPIYIHLDFDVLDPEELSDLRFPVPGGTTLAQVIQTLERVKREGNLAGILLNVDIMGDVAVMIEPVKKILAAVL
jgi:arginase